MNRRTAVSMMAMMAASGCTFNRSGGRDESVVTRIGDGGQLIEPKRCTLRVAILVRPLRDAAVDAALWSVTDEQAIPAETRRVLEANGLRIGVLAADLPHAVEAALNAPPPHRVEQMHISRPDGDNSPLISLRDATPQVSLLLNRDGRAFGKDYKDASGWLRVTAVREGSVSVKLHIVPEIHHGAVQRGYTALPNAGTLAPQEFMQKDGQQEDTLRELAADLVVQPGHAVAIGCSADSKGSLGSFLFTQPEKNSDRLLQKAVLIWADRNALGVPEAEPGTPSGLVPIEPPKS